jgi:hypothetical protein
MRQSSLKIGSGNLQPFLEQFELPEDPQDRLAVLSQLEHLIAGLRQQVEHELEEIRAEER